MPKHNEAYSVKCDITITTPVSGEHTVPIGLLYEALIDADKKTVLAKIALSEGGTHADIFEELLSGQENLLHESSDDMSKLPVRSSNGASHNYFIDSWLEKGPEHADFPAYGFFCTPETNPDKTVALGAELSARALLLTNKAFYQIQGRSVVVWSAEELASVPKQNMI